jgi:uncharacterized protein
MSVREIPVNSRKIINDPVYGFLHFPFELVFSLVEHPYVQRLRNIKQLGLTNFVYPGANHTRFQHALGASFLMGTAIEAIRSKGHEISEEEAEAVTVAILLHDIGHGPFSHALEKSIIEGIEHEQLSLLFMQELNKEYNGRLDLAIRIFTNSYSKKFLHQLVASQLDMDRLDYLRRDSFFTGVTEGAIGSDRIIKMLNVKDDELVIDIKGIYSIEKFLVARRLMYWQVYLHKTVLAAENLLVMILKRAKELSLKGEKLFGSPSLLFFLQNKISGDHFSDLKNAKLLELFSHLDDHDIMSAAKVWIDQPDKVLSYLCKSLLERKLYGIEIKNKTFDPEKISKLKEKIKNHFKISLEETNYILVSGEVSNNAYSSLDDRIKILMKDGTTQDITEASDMLNLAVLSKTVKKYFLCYPKEIKNILDN